MLSYRYELRRGDDVVTTGHLTHEEALEVGDRIVIGSRPGIIRSIDAQLGERELRLVVQMLREDTEGGGRR